MPIAFTKQLLERESEDIGTMGDTWYTNLQVFLDENGAIAAPKGPARKMAEHITSIVAMASRPELIPLPEYQVRCRRRPGRKPCTGIIQEILHDMFLKEKPAIANLDEDKVPYLQYAFDICLRNQVGEDNEGGTDVICRIWK